MKIKISETKLSELNVVKDDLMLSKLPALCFVESFTYERVEESFEIKHWFKPTEVKRYKSIYLTDIVLRVYNEKGKFWGYVQNEEQIRNWINYFDLYELKDRYQTLIKEPLELLKIESK